MRILTRLLPAVALLAAGGCDRGPEQVPVYPVSGQVIYDGKPAAKVQVYLFPTSAPMVPTIPSNPHGVTGPDGRFTLSTFGPGDGAPEGGYQVLLLWPVETDPEEEATVDRLMGWFDALHSKLTAQVKTGPNELPVIRIKAVTKPPEAMQGVPGRN
jgi:hypothetical protein